MTFLFLQHYFVYVAQLTITAGKMILLQHHLALRFVTNNINIVSSGSFKTFLQLVDTESLHDLFFGVLRWETLMGFDWGLRPWGFDFERIRL